MSYKEEFSKQWDTVCNYIGAEVLKSCQKLGRVDLNTISGLLENEKRRWTLAGQYHNAWLQKLAKNNPEIAQEFTRALSTVTLKPVDAPAAKSIDATTIGLGAAGMVVGVAATMLMGGSFLMKWPLVMQIVCGAAGGVVGLKIGKGLSAGKQDQAFDQQKDAYVQQLRSAGEKLYAIVEKADT